MWFWLSTAWKHNCPTAAGLAKYQVMCDINGCWTSLQGFMSNVWEILKNDCCSKQGLSKKPVSRITVWTKRIWLTPTEMWNKEKKGWLTVFTLLFNWDWSVNYRPYKGMLEWRELRLASFLVGEHAFASPFSIWALLSGFVGFFFFLAWNSTHYTKTENQGTFLTN